MKRSRFCRPSPAVAAALIVFVSVGSARASVPITLDVSDGYTFSGVQRIHTLSGIGQLPLGPNFATTPTLVELIQQQSAAVTLRAVFPGQGGQTILIDTGDPILFEYSAEGMTFQVRLTSVGTPGFGGGLGNTIEFTTTADLEGTAEGVANINLGNLGFLAQINSMSLLLGNDGSSFAQHDLGVDLNGNGMNDVLTINNFVGAGSVFTDNAPFFDYTIVPPGSTYNLDLRRGTGVPPFTFNGSGGVNPNFGLTLDTVEWTMTQDIVIPAVPEPSTLTLGMLAALVVACRCARQRRP